MTGKATYGFSYSGTSNISAKEGIDISVNGERLASTVNLSTDKDIKIEATGTNLFSGNAKLTAGGDITINSDNSQYMFCGSCDLTAGENIIIKGSIGSSGYFLGGDLNAKAKSLEVYLTPNTINGYKGVYKVDMEKPVVYAGSSPDGAVKLAEVPSDIWKNGGYNYIKYVDTSFISSYTIVDSEDIFWAKGSNTPLVVESTAPSLKFKSVSIGGTTLDEGTYSVNNASDYSYTAVSLSADYLETLGVGEFTIEIESEDGTASATFSIYYAEPEIKCHVKLTGEEEGIELQKEIYSETELKEIARRLSLTENNCNSECYVVFINGGDDTNGYTGFVYWHGEIRDIGEENRDEDDKVSCSELQYYAGQGDIIMYPHHDYGEYVSNGDATIKADGTKTRVCKDCGDEDTVTDEGTKIEIEEKFLWVNGVEITADNIEDGVKIGDATASFNLATYTLTFDKSVTFTDGYEGYSIYYSGSKDLNVVFADESDNVIKGICNAGKKSSGTCTLTIKGAANLTLLASGGRQLLDGIVNMDGVNNVTIPETVESDYGVFGAVNWSITGDLTINGHYICNVFEEAAVFKAGGNIKVDVKEDGLFIFNRNTEMTAGGDIALKGESAYTYAGSTLTLDAKGNIEIDAKSKSNLVLSAAEMTAGGDITIKGESYSNYFSSPLTLNAEGNIGVDAISTNGFFVNSAAEMTAGGDITIKGESYSNYFSSTLTLDAKGDIKVDAKSTTGFIICSAAEMTAGGDITIKGESKLGYFSSTLTLNAEGNIEVDAKSEDNHLVNSAAEMTAGGDISVKASSKLSLFYSDATLKADKGIIIDGVCETGPFCWGNAEISAASIDITSELNDADSYMFNKNINLTADSIALYNKTNKHIVNTDCTATISIDKPLIRAGEKAPGKILFSTPEKLFDESYNYISYVKNVTYEVTKGADSEWYKCTEEGLLVGTNADVSKFDNVYVDGEIIDSANYTLATDSTEVEFAPEYLDLLELGEHEIVIAATDGYATTSLTVKPDALERALERAKKNAKAEIDTAVGTDTSEEVAKAAEEAKKNIEAAESVEEVEAAKEEGLDNIAEARIPEPTIKGICQMPDPEGRGILLGLEASSIKKGYSVEILVLDCTLLAENKPAWIYTTEKCGIGEDGLWTIVDLQYGYYWTLFRIYDKEGELVDEACYGFENI